MNLKGSMKYQGNLQAQVIHADGSAEPAVDLGSKEWQFREFPIIRPWVLILLLLIAGIGVIALRWIMYGFVFGVVTTAGVNYMAADFLAASSNRINAFTFHDCGTGTTAESIAQTALVTPAGSARVSGTGSNPSANIYRSVATITPGSALAITEWGIFSASSAGTMWDRRLFSAINVSATDSIQFTYNLTCTAGG